MSRYELNSAEERYQRGNDLVLANKLGIIDEQEMEALESGLLLMLYEQLFIEGQPPEVLALITSARGIANGWGMYMTGQGGCVTLT